MTSATAEMARAEYDAIGALFKAYEGKPAHAVQTRTLLELAGDVTSKSVLDLACGYGYFGRELYKRGAAKVVGVDISEKMIGLAREESRKNSDPIIFHSCNVSEMGMLGSFDIAIAAFLFNYAESLAELADMFGAVARNLKPRGRLVAYTVEPDYKLSDGNFTRYVVSIIGEEPWQEGHRMRAEFATPIPSPFTFYRWSRKDYERAIADAGFSACRWRKPLPLREEIESQPAGFWDVCRNSCFHTALVCER